MLKTLTTFFQFLGGRSPSYHFGFTLQSIVHSVGPDSVTGMDKYRKVMKPKDFWQRTMSHGIPSIATLDIGFYWMVLDEDVHFLRASFHAY